MKCLKKNTDVSLDILGIKPVGEALNTGVKKSFEGVEGFLKAVCLPALEELGLLLKNHVQHWRLNNIMRILEKSKGMLVYENNGFQISAHPRVALSIIENGSLIDNDDIQELWAGLFASSCIKEGQDDENLVFIDLLKQLTLCEAKIFKYACENCSKVIHPNGLVIPANLDIDLKVLNSITDITDLERLDRELDHLRSLEILTPHAGFSSTDLDLRANITPTSLALSLFVKTKGSTLSLSTFWKDILITPQQEQEQNTLTLEEYNKRYPKTAKRLNPKFKNL